MPTLEDSTFILGFTAYDVPYFPTASQHAVTFVIDDDCHFNGIRVDNPAREEGEDEVPKQEGYSGNTYEQAGGVFVHAIPNDDCDDCSMARKRLAF